MNLYGLVAGDSHQNQTRIQIQAAFFAASSGETLLNQSIIARPSWSSLFFALTIPRTSLAHKAVTIPAWRLFTHEDHERVYCEKSAFLRRRPSRFSKHFRRFGSRINYFDFRPLLGVAGDFFLLDFKPDLLSGVIRQDSCPAK